MTKQELVAAVASATAEDEVVIESVLNAVTEEITQALTAGDVVHLGPLGTFATRAEAEHAGYSLSTHELTTVPASTRILFHPSSALHAAVATPSA